MIDLIGILWFSVSGVNGCRSMPDGECGRDECLIFFGVVRDCAHAIQSAAADRALRAVLEAADDSG